MCADPPRPRRAVCCASPRRRVRRTLHHGLQDAQRRDADRVCGGDYPLLSPLFPHSLLSFFHFISFFSFIFSLFIFSFHFHFSFPLFPFFISVYSSVLIFFSYVTRRGKARLLRHERERKTAHVLRCAYRGESSLSESELAAVDLRRDYTIPGWERVREEEERMIYNEERDDMEEIEAQDLCQYSVMDEKQFAEPESDVEDGADFGIINPPDLYNKEMTDDELNSVLTKFYNETASEWNIYPDETHCNENDIPDNNETKHIETLDNKAENSLTNETVTETALDSQCCRSASSVSVSSLQSSVSDSLLRYYQSPPSPPLLSWKSGMKIKVDEIVAEMTSTPPSYHSSYTTETNSAAEWSTQKMRDCMNIIK